MRVEIDRNRCIGAGMCMSLAPDLFDLRDEDGKAHVLLDPVPAELEASARDAVTCCPQEAISASADGAAS